MAEPGDKTPRELVQDSNVESLRQDEAEAERLLNILKKELTTTKELAEAQAKITELEEEQLRLQEEGKDLTDAQAASLQKYQVQLSLVNAEIEKNNKEKLKAEEKYGELIAENIEKRRDEAKELKEQIEDYEKMFAPFEKLPGIFGKIGGQIKKSAQLGQNMSEAGNSIAKLGEKFNSPVLAKFGLNFQTQMSAAGAGVVAFGFVGVMALTGVTKAILSLTIEIDKLSKSLNAAVGINRDFKKDLTDLSVSAAASGVTMQEASEAIKSMVKNVSSFNKMNGAAQKKVRGTIARLQKLGVSTESSAKAIDHFSRTLNMGTEEAADLTAEIALMGQQSGISSTQMMDNFSQLQKRIAVFGKNSTEVLHNLSLQARAAGVAVGTLTNMSSKFDQFGTAVDTVSQLNAVLGTNIDAIGLMNMSDDQQVDTLLRQIRARTGSIDTLDKHTQRLIANQIANGDVAEAQRLINSDPTEFEAYNKSLQEQNDIQNQLAEQTKQLVPVMDRFKIMMNELLLQFAPVGEELLAIAASVLENRKLIMGFVAGLTTVVSVGGSVFALLKFLGIAFAVLNSPILVTIGVLTAVGFALKKVFDILHLTGSPVFYELPKIVGENFGTMGEMAAAAGEMLKSPIKALHGMWDIFHKSGSPDLYELPAAFADNFASIEKSVKGTMGSLTKFISVMRDFASLDYDGFVAVKSDGAGTSMVMGSEGIIKQMSEGKLEVEVKMPEIKMPQINIEVVFMDNKLDGIIEAKIADMVGGAA